MTSSKVRSITLIDDDPDDFSIFSDALHSIEDDIEVNHIASTSSLPQKKEDCTVPDLLFLDINMPDRDGFDWIKLIRQKGYRMPVIMYSTASNQDFVQRAFKEGANMYLPKPDSFTTLQNALRKIISLDWNDPEKVKQRFLKDGRFQVFSISQSA
jgi:CheY-like chemotaxis protein